MSSAAVSAGSKNADKLMSNRVEESTKKGYMGKLREIAAYYKSSMYKGVPVEIHEDGVPEVPIPLAALSEFIGFKTLEQELQEEVASDDDDEDDDGDDDAPAAPPAKKPKRPEGGLYTPSHVNAYKAAVKWLYAEYGEQWPVGFETHLATLLTSYKKQFATAKVDGKVKSTEGKTNLKWSGFCMLAHAFMTHRPTSTTSSTPTASGKKHATLTGSFFMSTMGWLFHMLCWNLIARSKTVDALTASQLSWVGDHMVINIVKSKKDLTGETTAGPRACYANPLNPCVCFSSRQTRPTVR